MNHSTPRRWLVAAPLVLVSALALTACDRSKPGEPVNSTPAPATVPVPEPVTPATPAPSVTPGPAADTSTGTSGSATTAPASPSFGPSTPAPAADAASLPADGASSK